MDSNYTTDREIIECQQPWNIVYLMTLWGTNLSKIIAGATSMFLIVLWAQQWYHVIPGSLSMLRVTPVGTKSNLRENVSLSLLEIRTLLNSTPSHPKPRSSSPIHGTHFKDGWQKLLNSMKFAARPSECDQKSLTFKSEPGVFHRCQGLHKELGSPCHLYAP